MNLYRRVAFTATDRKKLMAGLWAALSAVVAQPVQAVDFAFSGFATVGFAQSDQEYNYQRFVNKQGTFKRDSMFGIQMDAKLDNEFGVTVQGKLAPALNNDQDVEATITRAFLSWRPTNDWLVRIGRLHAPVYLNSEHLDVGVTYDFARLPAEVYASVPSTDADGIYVAKTWNVDDSEVTLNGYWASAKMPYRYYFRDNVPPLLSSGAYFVSTRQSARGLILTVQQDDNIFMVGAHDIDTKIFGNLLMPTSYPYVNLLPGVGYYQTANLLPGPGVLSVDNFRSQAYFMAADMRVGQGFRVVGEYVRSVVPVAAGPDSQGGYLALLKPIGAWTPYVSLARLVSMSRTRDMYNKVNGNTLPSKYFGSDLINAAQRAGADGIIAYDQSTWAIGTSYRINPTSKLKAEWAQTRTGDMSQFIDVPPGGTSGKQVINVFSLSYNVVF